MCFFAAPAAAAAAGSAAAGSAAAAAAATAASTAAAGAAAAGTAAAGTAAAAGAGTFLGISNATWGALGTAASLAGTGLSAYGMYTQSQAMKDQAAYQAAVQRNNQLIANRQAEDVLQRGQLQERQYRSRVAQIKSEQLVGLVGQGVDVTEGTSVDLLSETAALGELDAQTIRANAERAAYDTRVQATNFGASAQMSQLRSEAENPLVAGGGTLLSGLGSVASKWYKS